MSSSQHGSRKSSRLQLNGMEDAELAGWVGTTKDREELGKGLGRDWGEFGWAGGALGGRLGRGDGGIGKDWGRMWRSLSDSWQD